MMLPLGISVNPPFMTNQKKKTNKNTDNNNLSYTKKN